LSRRPLPVVRGTTLNQNRDEIPGNIVRDRPPKRRSADRSPDLSPTERLRRAVSDRLPASESTIRTVPWSSLPIVVGAFAAFSWLLLEWGVEPLGVAGLSPAYDPLSILSGMVLHSGPDHYWGNMRLLVPLGIVLTLLSNNRHVLGLILVSHVPAAMVYGFVAGPIVGSSGVAFGIAAAALVRSTGVGLQNASMETLQATILGLLTPLVAGLLVVAIFNVPPGVAHFGHFFSFLFGAGYEAIVVLSEHERADPRPQRVRLR
jgi:membrane associated rhomboid family serine protease